MLRFIAHFSKQRVLCSRTFPTKWNLCEIYCQKKHVQNIQWSFIPHVAFYRLPEWNGDYENATKCDIKCAVKIIILNKKYICTAYSKISKSHLPTDQLWGTRLHISYGRNKWQFQGNLLAYGALQNRCQPMGHKFILVGTEIHSMPDGCTTACHQSCKKKKNTSRGFVFLYNVHSEEQSSVCLSVICSSCHPSFSCTFGQHYWRRGRWRDPWSSGDRKVCSWW